MKPRNPVLAWMAATMMLSLAAPVLLAQPPGASPPAVEDATPPAPEATHRIRGSLTSVMGRIEVPAGEVRDGDVVCILCDARVEGEVRGDLVVILGSLHLTGAVRGDMVAVLTDGRLGPGAEVYGELVHVGGGLEDAGVVTHGERVDVPLVRIPGSGLPMGVLGALVLWSRLFKLLVFFLVLLVVTLLLPGRVELISSEAPVRLGLAYLAGFGGYAVAYAVLALLVVTVVGIPLAAVGYLLLVFLKALGMAGLFHALGARMARSLGREVSVLGGVLLGFLPYALLLGIPPFFGLFGVLVSWGLGLALWLLLEWPALGLVILTRMGTWTLQPLSHAPASAPPPDPGAVHGPPGRDASSGPPPQP